MSQSTSTPRVFDMLAESFANEGVEVCFSLLGDANMNWATRLEDHGCRLIHVRHEHCAASAAMAYARKSGEVGVATVTCGPGLTQIMTALPAAVRAGLPMVIFAGEAPLKTGWYNQGIDQAPFVHAAGAEYISLHHVERMPIAIRDAFLKARTERRPVVLGIPMDLQNQPAPASVAQPTPSREIAPVVSAMPPNPEDVARTAALIDGARRIVVMAGLGSVSDEAVAACRELAARTDALLATTLPARGLFADDPFSIGIAGGFSPALARECLAEADLIVAVGCSLAHHNSDGGKLWPNATVLQVDTAPVTLSQGRVAAGAHLRSDAALGVRALTGAVAARPAAWRTPDLAARIADRRPPATNIALEPGLHDPNRVVAALEAHIPEDWELVNSSGHCSYFFAQMPSRPFKRFLTIREFGAIGNGTSYAMGVAAARPDQTVVLFDGDGSLMMHLQEIETIQRHGMNVLIVVMNDGAYGSEIHKLRSEGLPDHGAIFGRPDFASIARALGLGGATVTDLDALPDLIAEFSVKGGAAIWDIPVSDKVTSPLIDRAHPPRPA